MKSAAHLEKPSRGSGLACVLSHGWNTSFSILQTRHSISGLSLLRLACFRGLVFRGLARSSCPGVLLQLSVLGDLASRFVPRLLSQSFCPKGFAQSFFSREFFRACVGYIWIPGVQSPRFRFYEICPRGFVTHMVYQQFCPCCFCSQGLAKTDEVRRTVPEHARVAHARFRNIFHFPANGWNTLHTTSDSSNTSLCTARKQPTNNPRTTHEEPLSSFRTIHEERRTDTNSPWKVHEQPTDKLRTTKHSPWLFLASACSVHIFLSYGFCLCLVHSNLWPRAERTWDRYSNILSFQRRTFEISGSDARQRPYICCFRISTWTKNISSIVYCRNVERK